LPAIRPSRLLLAGLIALLLATQGRPLLAQVNFKPLEQGDYTEEEQKIVTLKGLEAGLDYALRMSKAQYGGLSKGGTVTQLNQIVRLRLSTVFDQDLGLHLVLEPDQRNVRDTDIRAERGNEAGRLGDGQPLSLGVRELYFGWRFNPRSALLLGKHELSIGDRRGKVFDGIVQAFTFDCTVGTWCMPFGAALLGTDVGDGLFHWALQYTAWDEQADGFRDSLAVEIFRIVYTENNVPLGRNLGPTVYNPDNPTNSAASVAGSAPASQLLLPDGQPVYYDARHQNYFGFRVNWEAGSFFFNFDVTSNQGSRDYHPYRDANGVELGTLPSGAQEESHKVQGSAVESEIGIRWPRMRLGLRLMNATGDTLQNSSSGSSYLRGLSGYHEITPGAYRGARLYFNGGDSEVTDGAGLGHSVNNTRLVGIFYDYEDADNRKVAYSLGLYQLLLNHAILNADGERVYNIGLEWDNVLTFFLRKRFKLQFEANAIQPRGAFALNDYTPPDTVQTVFVQALGRLVYSF
jgi:hypothetical protein